LKEKVTSLVREVKVSPEDQKKANIERFSQETKLKPEWAKELISFFFEVFF
jgi:hypothetical protein